MASTVLIGPGKAGKSTVARLLSEQTGLPRRNTADINFDNYLSAGYDKQKGQQIWTEQGEHAANDYVRPFYALAVRDLLAQPGDAIYDLESEYVALADPALLAQLINDLKLFSQVVLLMPSPDLEESVRVLRGRESSTLEANIKVNDFFLQHPSNRLLAKKIFYTAGHTPAETADEILASMDLNLPEPVILIGPMFTGKSTLASLLSRKLNRTQAPLDALRVDYYKEIGFDVDAAHEVYKKEGFFGYFLYCQPYHAHSVERVLADFPEGIIDFGAGHSVYADEALLERMRAVLAPYHNVILILPSPDLDEARRILRQRFTAGMTEFYDLHEEFTRTGDFEKVAKQTVYTEGKTPEQTVAEILALVNSGNLT
jgi:shikimate kinase